jgi:hypothetical protein
MRAKVKVVIVDRDKETGKETYTNRDDLSFELPRDLPSKLKAQARRQFIEANKGRFWVVGVAMSSKTEVRMYVTKGGKKQDFREPGWLGPPRGGSRNHPAP